MITAHQVAGLLSDLDRPEMETWQSATLTILLERDPLGGHFVIKSFCCAADRFTVDPQLPRDGDR